MSSALQAWKLAEEGVFTWIREILGGDYDQNAFLAELPKDYDFTNENYMWYFAVTGGGTPLDFDINMNTAGGCGSFQMNAELGGIFETREDAQECAGQIMDSTPMPSSTVDNVTRFKISENPTIERDIIPRKSDQAQGGDMRIWKLGITFEIIFEDATA